MVYLDVVVAHMTDSGLLRGAFNFRKKGTPPVPILYACRIMKNRPISSDLISCFARIQYVHLSSPLPDFDGPEEEFRLLGWYRGTEPRRRLLSLCVSRPPLRLLLRLLLRLGLPLDDLVFDGDLLRFLLGDGDLLNEGDLDNLPVGFRRRGGDLDLDGDRLIDRERDLEADRVADLPYR